MNKFFVVSFLSLGIVSTSCGNSDESSESSESSESTKSVTTANVNFNNKEDTISYFLGTTRVENLKNAQFYGELNKEMLIKGFKESISIDSQNVQKMNKKITELIGPDGQDFNRSNLDSGSFYLGKFDKYMLVVQLKEFGVENVFNLKMVENGFQDALNDKSKINESEKQKIQERMSELVEKAFTEKQMNDGLAFLKNNKKNPKVKVTASGLQYIVMKPGKGPKPKATSKVKVHYHGTTPQGEVFDSSVKRGEPASFPLNQVIPGWTEGLQLMSVGAKYKFYIPQELAYGANPQPGSAIKPYMPLVFEVELIAIEK